MALSESERKVIKNIGMLCEENLEELPYWETINNCLKKLPPDELQDVICKLVRKLIRIRTFENARIRGKYWQSIIDGTQLCRSKKNLGNQSLFCTRNKRSEDEYTEYYYYVLEAKLVLHEKIQVSILTEFIENENREMTKQDNGKTSSHPFVGRSLPPLEMLRIGWELANEMVLKG